MIKKTDLKEFDFGLLMEIEKELRRAKARFPGKINSLHEGYAIILEELDELWTEIKLSEEERDLKKIRLEGIHVISMVVRMLQDLVL